MPGDVGTSEFATRTLAAPFAFRALAPTRNGVSVSLFCDKLPKQIGNRIISSVNCNLIYKLTISIRRTLRRSLRCGRSSTSSSRWCYWLTRWLTVAVLSTRTFRWCTIRTGHFAHEYFYFSLFTILNHDLSRRFCVRKKKRLRAKN